MSTDFEDPQLDELLAGYARTWNADFSAPPLAGMLEQATSSAGPSSSGCCRPWPRSCYWPSR